MSDEVYNWQDSQAHREGWWLSELARTPCIFSCALTQSKLPGYRAGLNVLELNVLARNYVKEKAAEGSPYHIEALARTQLL